MKTVTADPEDLYDYEWNFEGDYPDTDDIASQTVTSSDASMVVSNIAKDGDRVVAWATGGTLGTTVRLKCTINTTGGRRFVRRTDVFIRLR